MNWYVTRFDVTDEIYKLLSTGWVWIVSYDTVTNQVNSLLSTGGYELLLYMDFSYLAMFAYCPQVDMGCNTCSKLKFKSLALIVHRVRMICYFKYVYEVLFDSNEGYLLSTGGNRL